MQIFIYRPLRNEITQLTTAHSLSQIARWVISLGPRLWDWGQWVITMTVLGSVSIYLSFHSSCGNRNVRTWNVPEVSVPVRIAYMYGIANCVCSYEVIASASAWRMQSILGLASIHTQNIPWSHCNEDAWLWYPEPITTWSTRKLWFLVFCGHHSSNKWTVLPFTVPCNYGVDFGFNAWRKEHAKYEQEVIYGMTYDTNIEKFTANSSMWGSLRLTITSRFVRSATFSLTHLCEQSSTGQLSVQISDKLSPPFIFHSHHHSVAVAHDGSLFRHG